MNIRPELKLIAEALKTLKQDGIIRTKNLVGDLGEYYCSQLFGLTLNLNVVETGFDAFDTEDKINALAAFIILPAKLIILPWSAQSCCVFIRVRA